MRLNKVKNIIKEQILLLEKEKWFTSMKAANDACVDCPDCCQVSDYQTNWLGVIIAVKMACVGCPDGASRGTVIHPNGQFHGVLSKPEGDPFNPAPQMMARGEEKACPCENGDMLPECCPKKSIREEMIDDLKDQVIIPNKIKPKSGGCGCGKKR